MALCRFWRNLGNGLFDTPRTMNEVPAGVHLRDPGVQFADMNGDGRADLLVLQQSGYFPLSFQGRWSAQGFVEYASSPSVNFGDDDLRLVDLDGDGVIDALRTGVSFELFFNDPAKGWETVETRPRQPLDEFPDLSFSDPRVKLADLTGDNLQDFVLVEQGRIDYWPYLGHGRWGRRVTMKNSPVFRDGIPVPGGGFDPSRVLLGDLDGDGLDDILYIEPNRLTFWINQGGEGWSDPIIITATPPFTDVDAVRLADMLGTGMAGVLWTFDRTAGAASNFQFLDLTGGLKPYVLEQMDNHMGAVTRVEYASSTEFYLADLERPETRWKTPLPFPVQVVERVEVDRCACPAASSPPSTATTTATGTAPSASSAASAASSSSTRRCFEEFNAPGTARNDDVDSSRSRRTLLAAAADQDLVPPRPGRRRVRRAHRGRLQRASTGRAIRPPCRARRARCQLLQSLPASHRGRRHPFAARADRCAPSCTRSTAPSARTVHSR